RLLAARGAGPEGYVAVALERSADLVTALLAVAGVDTAGVGGVPGVGPGAGGRGGYAAPVAGPAAGHGMGWRFRVRGVGVRVGMGPGVRLGP
ncbi:hypothetical protein ABZ990_29315, partial [Streptomyces sp. NPDC046203]|uniref:hypothetical protein n=1 Tax=Streptomyces sp. NPDC046203 TaxID=3154602 RepID=UPI0033E9AD70